MRKTRNIVLGTAALALATASVCAGADPVPVERNDVAWARTAASRQKRCTWSAASPPAPSWPTSGRSRTAQSFIQSVQFDNTDGFRHAPSATCWR